MSDYNKKSFCALASEYHISIPLIQREYAQGRDDKQGEEVRKNFVPELIKVLTGKEKSLEMDFVFGVKEENVFIPLDGQQRLTTLLLLHWYFGAHKGTNWSFTYKSRRMANSFVKGLLAEQKYDKNDTPSEWIKGKSWFFENWLTDPTVSGMLTMLDDIHKEAKEGCDSDNLNNITFYLYPIEQLDADNAYTKMNARGEPLTQWENIKALLDKKAQDFCFLSKPWTTEHAKCARSQWVNNIDGDWLFKLEEYAGLKQDQDELINDDDKLESAIMRINCALRNIFDLAVFINLAKQINEEKIKTICGNSYGEEAEAKKKKDEKITLLQKEISKFHSHEALLSDYQTHVTRQTFEIAVDLFQALCKKKDVFEKGWSCTLCFWNSLAAENKSFTEDFVFNEKYRFADCIKFYAASRFSGENPSQWLRVIWNIIENSPEINNANFSDAIALIEELAPHSENIIEFLAGNNNKVEANFASDQVKEELLKARMIWNDHNVYNIIKEVECEIHFKGRIISLLPKAINSKNKYKDLTHEDIVIAVDLRKRFDKFVNFIKGNSYPNLGRELLKYGDYTLWSNGNNWQFVVSEESLFKMLHNKSERFYTNFIPAWIKFLDDNENTNGCAHEPTKWQYYFIKYTSILDKSSEKHGVFSWEGDFSCQLLANTTKHGYRCSPYVMAALLEPNEQHPAPWTNDSGDYYHIPNSETAVRIFQRDHIGLEIKTGEKITRIQWDPKKDKDFVEFIREYLKNTWQTL